MINSIKAEHKTRKRERKLAAGLALLWLQSPSHQEPESSSNTRVLLSHCRTQITPTETSDIYSCPVAIKWSLLSAFLSAAVAGRSVGVQHLGVCVICALCLRTLCCHDKLQNPCQHRKGAAGPCQRESLSHRAVCRHWEALLGSIPIFSPAGRTAHSMKPSQVFFLVIPCVLR